jgi:hypothetical protein
MIPLLIEEDIRHEFLSGRDTAERGASTGQVAWTYVVEVRSSTRLSRLLPLNIAVLVAPRKFCH